MLRKLRKHIVMLTVMIFMLFSISCSIIDTSQAENKNNQNLTKSIVGNDLFVKNRKKLAERINDNSILVLFSERNDHEKLKKFNDNSPDRNFYYVTGIRQQDSILMMVKSEGEIKEYIFTSGQNTKNSDEIKLVSGIKNIEKIEVFDKEFKKAARNKNMSTLYLDLGIGGKNFTEGVKRLKFAASRDYSSMAQKNIFDDMSEMRSIKSKEEIDNIRKAIEVTGEGIKSMMKYSRENVYEGELEVCFNTALEDEGILSTGFDSIIGSGKNGLELHYSNNNRVAPKDALVLVDVGAEYNYYTADISRTFPANGKFTDRQKQIYNIVLKAQEEVINSVKPGVTLLELQDLTKKILIEELTKIGLMDGKTNIRKYYMHGVSHELGLDVHDITVSKISSEPGIVITVEPGLYVRKGSIGGKSNQLGIETRDRNISKTTLQPGMVITVEPGLYIAEEELGIRIEDDVLVTENGCEVLSKDIIKTIEEIESFMKK